MPWEPGAGQGGWGGLARGVPGATGNGCCRAGWSGWHRRSPPENKPTGIL